MASVFAVVGICTKEKGKDGSSLSWKKSHGTGLAQVVSQDFKGGWGGRLYKVPFACFSERSYLYFLPLQHSHSPLVSGFHARLLLVAYYSQEGFFFYCPVANWPVKQGCFSPFLVCHLGLLGSFCHNLQCGEDLKSRKGLSR